MGFAILTGLMVIIAGFVLLNFLIPETDSVRTALVCNNPSNLTDGTKMFCLATDATIPYYIWIIFALVIGGIVTKLSIG